MFEQYEDMVTIDDVCQMLNIGKNGAYRLLKEGKLHAFKIGRIWKISKFSVMEYVTSNTQSYMSRYTSK